MDWPFQNNFQLFPLPVAFIEGLIFLQSSYIRTIFLRMSNYFSRFEHFDSDDFQSYRSVRSIKIESLRQPWNVVPPISILAFALWDSFCLQIISRICIWHMSICRMRSVATTFGKKKSKYTRHTLTFNKQAENSELKFDITSLRQDCE